VRSIKSKTMNIIEKGRVKFLKFKALDDISIVNHTVSTRYGGVSTLDGLETMNLGTYTTDTIENIRENYAIFCDAAGYDVKRIVLGNQTHSLNVRYATESDCGKGVFSERDYQDVDALITDVKSLPLVIHTADCVPVSFVDTVKKAIGVAHCGWRGTFGELSKITLDAMKDKFGTNPKDVISTIGPCICRECYEVSKDLYDEFLVKFGKSEALIERYSSYYIDLSLINKKILIDCGVNENNIFVSDVCTCCNTDLLYSHRGQGPKRGIFATVIELN
jgi:YfiH family protein